MGGRGQAGTPGILARPGPPAAAAALAYHAAMVTPAVDAAGFHRHLVEDTLVEVFGERDPGLLERLVPKLTTLELPGGAALMREGEPSDAMYLVLSGRLQASVEDPERGRVVIGSIGRGEPIGEMGVITRAPRSASVHALRDCILARLDAQDFAEALEAWPRAGLPLARKIIERLSRSRPTRRRQRVINVCIVPLHGSLDVAALAARLGATLSAELERAGKPSAVAVGTRAEVEASTGIGIEAAERDAQADAHGDYRRLLDWLDKREAAHRMQVFAAECADSAWTRLCLRHADLVLLAADADGDAGLCEVEQRHLAAASSPTALAQCLWLLHPDDRVMPRDTARWLAARPALGGDGFSHLHCRRGRDADWARLARVLAGQATGLVLAGGGARGFAHLGVMQALEEQGIDWDLVGGTSIGAVMGAYAAMDKPVATITAQLRLAFSRKPTGDLSLLPMMALLRGRRLRRVIDDALAAAVGPKAGIEDLWKPFFCVASNYSRQRAEVLRAGELSEALRASVAIPAALPPVLRGGDLLVDGGTFNNYPVDLMRAAGAARVIGVDLGRDHYRALEHPALPSSWALFVDRYLRPRSKRRYADLPSLGAIVVNVALMASTSHQKGMRERVDLGFRPDVAGIGLLDWAAFDRVVAIGLRHARERLADGGAGVTRPGRPAP
jgi:NTE family protein